MTPPDPGSIRLRALFDQEGTDKGEYAKPYEILLRQNREHIRRVLEIGIGSMLPGPSSMYGYAPKTYRPGASLRAWKAYFPNARIVGIDIQPDTQFEEDRIQTFLCDSTSTAAVEQLLSRIPSHPFDIIVDDGSHDGRDQLQTNRLYVAYALAVERAGSENGRSVADAPRPLYPSYAPGRAHKVWGWVGTSENGRLCREQGLCAACAPGTR